VPSSTAGMYEIFGEDSFGGNEQQFEEGGFHDNHHALCLSVGSTFALLMCLPSNLDKKSKKPQKSLRIELYNKILNGKV